MKELKSPYYGFFVYRVFRPIHFIAIMERKEVSARKVRKVSHMAIWVSQYQESGNSEASHSFGVLSADSLRIFISSAGITS